MTTRAAQKKTVPNRRRERERFMWANLAAYRQSMLSQCEQGIYRTEPTSKVSATTTEDGIRLTATGLKGAGIELGMIFQAHRWKIELRTADELTLYMSDKTLVAGSLDYLDFLDSVSGSCTLIRQREA